MKKIYNKPEICIENFLLSEMIASCSFTVTASTTETCATNIDEDVLMNAWKALGLFSSGCKDSVETGDKLIWAGTKLCYHTSQGAGVFAS